MALTKLRGRVAVFASTIFWVLRIASMGQEQQNSFEVHTIKSGWGYHSAAFTPGDGQLAVIAVKGFREEQGLQITQELQIWDFRNIRLTSEQILSREKSSPDATYEKIAIYGYVRSGSMILLCRNDHLLLLDSQTLREIRKIGLATGKWPAVPPPNGFSFIKGVTVDKDGRRAAVLLQWERSGGGELRVYDLNSGVLVRSWDYHSLRKNDRNADFGGADISADGRRVAVSVIPFLLGEGALHSPDRNVFVLDVDSGATISEINTGYPAEDVRFAPTEPPVLLTVSADNYDRHRSRQDTIKVWDPVSGRLLRELASAPAGVHFQVQTSSDGRIVLGYTGAEKFIGRWWLGQEENGLVEYDQFTLWDLASGKVIASSPQIKPAQSHGCFLISPNGDVVLLYPQTSDGETLTLYELRRTP